MAFWLSFCTMSDAGQNNSPCNNIAGTGLKINLKKKELMKINTTDQTPVTVGGEPIRQVESLIYMGSVVDRQGGADRDIKSKIGKGCIYNLGVQEHPHYYHTADP